MSNKCSCQVNILGSNRFRSCKRSVYININNKIYCWSHAAKFLGKTAIIIQSKSRSMICRRKVKNLYINLPDEIKNIVLFYLRQDYHYKKYKKLCSIIISKKIEKFSSIVEISNIIQNQISVLSPYETKVDFIKYLSNIYNLFLNNWENINFDIINDLDNLIKLYMFCDKYIWGKTIWNGINLTSIINSIVSYNYYTYNIVKELELKCSKFKVLWEKKFIYIRTGSHSSSILLR